MNFTRDINRRTNNTVTVQTSKRFVFRDTFVNTQCFVDNHFGDALVLGESRYFLEHIILCLLAIRHRLPFGITPDFHHILRI